jgi:hypothetical protein
MNMPAPGRCPNALTFDVEDWHQLVEWKLNGDLSACSAAAAQYNSTSCVVISSPESS